MKEIPDSSIKKIHDSSMKEILDCSMQEILDCSLFISQKARGSASRLNVGWFPPKRSVGQETTRSAERLVFYKDFIVFEILKYLETKIQF